MPKILPAVAVAATLLEPLTVFANAQEWPNAAVLACLHPSPEQRKIEIKACEDAVGHPANPQKTPFPYPTGMWTERKEKQWRAKVDKWIQDLKRGCQKPNPARVLVCMEHARADYIGDMDNEDPTPEFRGRTLNVQDYPLPPVPCGDGGQVMQRKRPSGVIYCGPLTTK
jgi:hypothetical protein